jgi:hypothetical protein
MIVRAMLAVVMLSVVPPMPDRSRVMTQTKRDTLVLQVGGFGMGLTTPRSKKLIVTKVEQRNKLDRFQLYLCI